MRDDSEEVIYSRSIVNPINFPSRVNRYVRKNHSNKINELLNFYETAYKKRYGILKEGNTPNQYILGKLAYPGHNPYGKFDYSKFPPESIKEIKISTKYYTWDKEFIEEKVVAKKDWK